MNAALVTSAWVPVRAEPSHQTEMVSQWLCGETLAVTAEEGGWLRCEDPDGYTGWSPAGSLMRVDPEEAGEWQREATGWSLGTWLDWSNQAARHDSTPGLAVNASGAPNHLPWGARVRVLSDGHVGLPNGAVVRVLDHRAVLNDAELGDRFFPIGLSIARTAAIWLGTPYLWGGRTQSGVDCSGLIQAVYRVHGVALPRDSEVQAEVGPGLWPQGDHRECSLTHLELGDLLFFAPEGRGVTHVAIVAGESRIIHASASNSCVAYNDLRGEGRLERLLRDSIAAWTRPLGIA